MPACAARGARSAGMREAQAAIAPWLRAATMALAVRRRKAGGRMPVWEELGDSAPFPELHADADGDAAVGVANPAPLGR